MSFRYQRRIRLLPGLHLNLSKSGIGVSAGARGFHVGVDSRRRPYVSAGLVGTGLSWREYVKPSPRPAARPGSSLAGCLLLAAVALLLLALVSSRR